MFIGKPSISAAGLANFSHRFRPRRRQKISSTASTSIPLNIAEGNGKFSARDRARFFEMARGSTLECAACLDVLLVRKVTKEELVAAQKDASFGSSKCSSACCVGSLTGQMFCGRKR